MKRRCQWGLGDNQCTFRAAYVVTADQDRPEEREIPTCGKHLTAVLQRELSRKDIPNVLVSVP